MYGRVPVSPYQDYTTASAAGCRAPARLKSPTHSYRRGSPPQPCPLSRPRLPPATAAVGGSGCALPTGRCSPRVFQSRVSSAGHEAGARRACLRGPNWLDTPPQEDNGLPKRPTYRLAETTVGRERHNGLRKESARARAAARPYGAQPWRLPLPAFREYPRTNVR